jgi:uncharacterized damage-inducible protein DinB
MIEYVKNLLIYQEWADAVFLRIWEKTPSALEDSEMLERWQHVVAVQKAFYDLLKSNDSKLPQADLAAPYSELKEQSKTNHIQLKTLVSDLSDTKLDQKIEIGWLPEHPVVLTQMEALMQILLHTQHHRAQNMTRLKTLGGRRIVIDWITWIWKGKPEAQWQ